MAINKRLNNDSQITEWLQILTVKVLKVITVSLISTAGIFFSLTVFAATSLSDSELAAISGAGVEPAIVEPLLDETSLPQEQQQPSQNNSNFISPEPFQLVDGMELAPGIFTILQSSANVKRDRNLVLSGDSQMNARGLNLENLLSSDFIAANNIFSGGSLTLDDVTSEIEVNQLNSLTQLHRSQGSMSSSILGYGYETTSHIQIGSESYDHRNYYSSDQFNQLSTVNLNESSWLVSVNKVNFSEQFNEENKIITFLEPVKFTIIAGGTIGLVVDGFFDDEYGAEASYTGLFIEGPSASVNEIEPYGINGEDLLIDTTVRLGLIDFGTFESRICVVDCAEVDKDLGELEILNLFDFLALLDPAITSSYGISFSTDGVILEGMGSVFDEDLNLNTGFAMVGSGYLKVLDPASIKIKSEFELSVAAGIGFTLDLSSIDLGLFDPWPKSWSWPDDSDEVDNNILDIDVSFTLLNIEGGLFDKSFSGEFIAILGPGNVMASSDVSNNDPEREENLAIVLDMDVVNISDSTFSEFYQYTTFTGGQMTGAEAELLALSEGSLNVDNSSTISLSQSAQQNIRVFNGVNAVSSVAANALNISQLPVVSRGLSSIPGTSIQQQNLFVQHR